MTKNGLMPEMIATCVNNILIFRYLLMDSWFGSVGNFDFFVKKKKNFIAALKDNRLIALIEEDKQAVCGWLKGYAKEVLLI